VSSAVNAVAVTGFSLLCIGFCLAALVRVHIPAVRRRGDVSAVLRRARDDLYLFAVGALVQLRADLALPWPSRTRRSIDPCDLTVPTSCSRAADAAHPALVSQASSPVTGPSPFLPPYVARDKVPATNPDRGASTAPTVTALGPASTSATPPTAPSASVISTPRFSDSRDTCRVHRQG
jgi:hypothetical protein